MLELSSGRIGERLTARVQRNPQSLHERIRELAGQTGTPVEAVDAAWTDSGITLGSHNVVNVKKPRIMVLMDEPVRGRSYGALWFTLEQRYGIDFTAVRVADFNSINLYDYDVIVLPPGSASGYKNLFGEPGNAFLVHEPTGRGDVVLFAEQPVFRLYWRGLERLFVNSILLTPSF